MLGVTFLINIVDFDAVSMLTVGYGVVGCAVSYNFGDVFAIHGFCRIYVLNEVPDDCVGNFFSSFL